MREYIEEKMKEARELADYWFKKHQKTNSTSAFKEYKYFSGKEDAYYDCLEQYDISKKKENI